MKTDIEEILEAVFLHGKETPEQSYDLPEGQLTIHDAIEELTTYIKQRERKAVEDGVRGFWKWCEQFPLVIGVNAEGDEPETYLQTLKDKDV